MNCKITLKWQANGDDVSNILNTPVKDYADNFSKEMSFTKGFLNI